MPLIHVVRHGRVDHRDPQQTDPPLSAHGVQQAEFVAELLQRRYTRPLPLLSSPLRRCRETAAPLAALWGAALQIDERLREIPGPEQPGLQRLPWLNAMVELSWSELAARSTVLDAGYAARLADWRAGLHAALLACPGDAIAFSHFVAINALAVAVDADGPVSLLDPGHVSISTFDTDGGRVRHVATTAVP